MAAAPARIYYIDEGRHLRAIHTRRNAAGRYVPTGVQEIVSYPVMQAAIADYEGRPELHPSELGFTELGAGKVRRKIKTAAKKVAKSKIVQRVGKIGMAVTTAVAAVVPGAQGAAAGLAAAQIAMKTAKKVKAAKNAVKKAAPKAGAIATASQAIRARLADKAKPATKAGASLLQSRIVEAAKAVATLPADAQKAALDKVESRLDAYKVITPEGNTIWVSRDAIEQ